MDRENEYRRRGWWSEETVWQLFAANAAAAPQRLAVGDPPNRATIMEGEPQQWRYAELLPAAEQLARRLAGLGIGYGDVVVAQLPNVAESVLTFLAAARLGCIYSPLPVQYRQHELVHVLAAAKPKLILTAVRIDGHAHAAMAAELAQRTADVRVAAWGAGLPAGVADLEQIADDTPLPPLPDATTSLTINWTSGTEGLPKGVVRNHQRWLCLAQAVLDAADLKTGAVLLNPFPMANMAAYVGFVLPWLRTGGSLLLHHPFALPVFVSQLASTPIDFTAAPPALLNLMLLREEVAREARLNNVRVIGCGGAPLSPEMVEGFSQRFGIDIVNLFGSSEGGSLVSGAKDVPDPRVRAVCFPRWGVSGFDWHSGMAERVETRLVDPASEAEINTPGQPGELRFRGPGVFAGYYAAPEASARAFDAAGFYRSGDLFEIAGERGQYYRFVGRCKDLVIRGGVNISPEEVEGLLAGHPAVAEAAVIGYADPVMGEKMCVVAVAREAARPTLDELRRYLREERQVAEFKLPERVEWVTALPRNAMGKVVKRELRCQFGGV